MTKPDSVDPEAWDQAWSIVSDIQKSGIPAASGGWDPLDSVERIARAIMSARAEERERISVTLAALDSALCQFLNNANDEYDPRVWVPSIERDFRALSKAYNDCHVVGAMDLLVSAAAIRNRP